MSRDALDTLFTLRKRTVDSARQAVGVCVKAELDAVHLIKVLDDTRERDRLAEQGLAERPQFLDMMDKRLLHVQTERLALVSGLVAAEARTAEARTLLATARRAAEAVEQLIEERNAEAAAKIEKQEQHALDDITRSQRLARRRLAAKASAELSSAQNPDKL
jgi:flagellar biosynthesis chaperone FliJ